MSAPATKQRIVYFYIAYMTLFAILGLCSYFMANKAGLIGAPKPASNSPRVFISDVAYFDLPRMIVSIGAGGTQMRVQISLEVARDDLPALEGYQPRITDRLNGYFSRLEPKELTRPGYLPFLRQEMLRQINDAGAPVPVHDLMLRQLVIM